MKKREYNLHKRHILEQYQKAVAEATNQRDKALEGLESLWRAYYPNTGESPAVPGGAIPGGSTPTNTPSGYGALAESVRKAVDSLNGVFSVKDVVATMEKDSLDVLITSKRSSVAGCMNRLQRKKVIEVVEHGRGSAPSTYRKVENIKMPTPGENN